MDADDADIKGDPRIALAKATIVGGDDMADVQASRAINEVDQVEHLFKQAGALRPPHDPRTLILLFEHSNALRQNIDAYTTNIDGYGHRFEPIFEFNDDEAEEVIADALRWRSGHPDPDSGEEPPEDPNDVPEPSESEIEDALDEAYTEASRERQRLEDWFEFAAGDDMSFVQLRRMTRNDLEITGNAYWEVLRNGEGEIAQLNYLPSFTMRLRKRDDQWTPYNMKVRTPGFTYIELPRRKCFRRYMQSHGQQVVWFKELGDPRTVSARTGKAYQNLNELKAAEDHDVTATEVIHFAIHSSRSAYGIPRWIGALLAVMGNRQAEEVNFLYFDNKGVPPLAVLVSGGRLAEDSVDRITQYVENQIKGRKNFHSVLVIEAEPADQMSGAFGEPSGAMKIEIQPLTDAQMKDALFMEYDERNMDKVGMTFRLPRLLRGDVRDFNRATADAALEFTEGQVFSPERQSFDWVVNRRLLTELNARWWRFRSNGPTKANPLELVDMIHKLQDVFPPAVLQELAEEAFGQDFPDMDAPWTQYPLKVFIEALKQGFITSLDEDTPEWDPDDPMAEPEGDEDSEFERPEEETPAAGAPGELSLRKQRIRKRRKGTRKKWRMHKDVDPNKISLLVDSLTKMQAKLEAEEAREVERRLREGQRIDADADL